MRRWLLVLGVLVVHVVVLHFIGWTGSRLTGLQLMVDPVLERTLSVDDTAPSSSVPTTEATAKPPPPPTIGQTVQARTLPHAPVTRPAPDRVKETVKRAAKAPVNPHSPPREVTPIQVAETQSPKTPWQEPPSQTPVGANAAGQSGELGFHPTEPPPPEAKEHPPATATSAGQFWPPNTRLEYQLKGYFRGDLHGRARVQWQHSGDRYQAQIDVDLGLLASMSLISQGLVQPQRLWPQLYEESRRGRVRGVRFGDQWLTLNDGSQSPRPAELQDTVSQFIQLAQDLQTGRITPSAGTVVPVMLGRPGGVDLWEYDITGLEPTPTTLGPLDAWHFQPRARTRPSGAVSADMWFAPSLQHLPVRIRLSLGSDTWLDLTLNRVLQAD